MGLLDDIRHKVEELGDKAKGGLDAVRDKAGDLIEDARDKAGDLQDRVGQHGAGTEGGDSDTDADVSADTADADAEVAEQDRSEQAPLGESDDVGPDSSSTDAVQPGYVTGEDADSLSEGDLDAEEASDDDASDDDAPDDDALGGTDAPEEPDVESDVDPYDSPLTESIGDAVDADALAEAVEGGSDDTARR